MISRLKQDFLAASIKSSLNAKALVNKAKVLEEERIRSRSVKQKKIESKAIVDKLMENIEKEHHDTQVVLSEI